MTSPEVVREIERERERLDKATAILGYKFKDEELLLRALTHSSLLNEHKSAVGDNEILELLGDAVISLCTMEVLVTTSPHAGEGELTDRRAAHMSELALATRADENGLSPLLRTGRSIVGRVPTSARADVVEALLGAVYQDGGLDAARAVTTTILGEPPTSARPEAFNAKRALQERLQRVFGAPPTYEVSRVDGPNHAPTYEGVCKFAGSVLGSGHGGSKRTASESAASDALKNVTADYPDDDGLRAKFGAKLGTSPRDAHAAHDAHDGPADTPPVSPAPPDESSTS